MNYKTILLCAVIGVSMQSAWGMDDKDFALNDPLDGFFMAQMKCDQVQTKCDKECPGLQEAPESQELGTKISALYGKMQNNVFGMTSAELAEHTVQAEELAKNLETVLSGYHAARADRALVGAKLFVAVKLKYDKASIRFELSPEFKRIAPKITAFDKRRSELNNASSLGIIDLGIEAGCVAQELNAALMTYEQNNNNKK